MVFSEISWCFCLPTCLPRVSLLHVPQAPSRWMSWFHSICVGSPCVWPSVMPSDFFASSPPGHYLYIWPPISAEAWASPTLPGGEVDDLHVDDRRHLVAYNCMKLFSNNIKSFGPSSWPGEGLCVCFCISQYLPDVETRFSGRVGVSSHLHNSHFILLSLSCLTSKMPAAFYGKK